VAQGDLLARLEDADYRQKVRIDEATVRVRESNLALQLAGTRGRRSGRRSKQHWMSKRIWSRRRSMTNVRSGFLPR